jgi:hypothetical protein
MHPTAAWISSMLSTAMHQLQHLVLTSTQLHNQASCLPQLRLLLAAPAAVVQEAACLRC